MHKIIHKLIRYRRDGINIAADLNAAISVGDDSGAATSSVSSYTPIVQQNGSTRTESGAKAPTKEEVNDAKGSQ
jgi:hypothetical protein